MPIVYLFVFLVITSQVSENMLDFPTHLLVFPTTWFNFVKNGYKL